MWPLFVSQQHLKQFLIGTISNKLYYLIRDTLDSTIVTYTILKQITSRIKKLMWQIWLGRCNVFQSWKETMGITRKKEKAHKYKRTPSSMADNEEKQNKEEKFLNIVNIVISKFMLYNTNIFSLFKIDLGASYVLAPALAC